MSARFDDMLQFLASAGWQDAHLAALAGDASSRRYFRAKRGDDGAIVMDAPLGQVDDPAQFLRIADHLAGMGLSPPCCFAQDLRQGFLLLEDLGDGVFARLIDADPVLEMPLYSLAVDVLHILHSHPAPPDLPNLDAKAWADAAMLALTRYSAAIMGATPNPATLHAALSAAISQYADGPRVMILRDYHAENLIYLPARTGAARVGLLDFQLAQMGQPCYDLVSLLQDARRDVPLAVEASMSAYAAGLFGCDLAALQTSYAVFGAQRALRILGIFAQLCTHGGKPAYTHMIPRVWGQLQRNLAHPALADVARICVEVLPPPTPFALETLRSQCRIFP